VKLLWQNTIFRPHSQSIVSMGVVSICEVFFSDPLAHPLYSAWCHLGQMQNKLNREIRPISSLCWFCMLRNRAFSSLVEPYAYLSKTTVIDIIWTLAVPICLWTSVTFLLFSKHQWLRRINYQCSFFSIVKVPSCLHLPHHRISNSWPTVDSFDVTKALPMNRGSRLDACFETSITAICSLDKWRFAG